MKSCYKSNAPAVMAAIKAHGEESKVVSAAGKVFAAHFGGILLVENGIRRYRVAGLKFNPPKPARLWTHPNDKMGGAQRPRATITKATAEEKAQLAVLKADWKARFPLLESDFTPVMAAMGTSWGNCLFGGGGFSMFQHDGYVYVSTGVKLHDCMVEILASEYQAEQNAAEVEFDAAKVAP